MRSSFAYTTAEKDVGIEAEAEEKRAEEAGVRLDVTAKTTDERHGRVPLEGEEKWEEGEEKWQEGEERWEEGEERWEEEQEEKKKGAVGGGAGEEGEEEEEDKHRDLT